MLERERSCIYEEFIRVRPGEEDSKRRAVLKDVREVVNDYIHKCGDKVTSADFFIRYSDAFCKHEQDYVNIAFHDQVTGTATKATATALSFTPIPMAAGMAVGAAKDKQKSLDEERLGVFFRNHRQKIQNELNRKIGKFKFKVTSAANVLEIEIHELRRPW